VRTFNSILADVMFAGPVSECWVDINEILSCGSNTLDQFFTSDRDVLIDAFGVELCNVDSDHEQLPEVSISELESLLLMDSVVETAAGSGHLAGYVTLDAGEIETIDENTVAEFDFVHDDIEEEEPATISYDVNEGTSSEEEDDIRDRTWSYRPVRRQSWRGRRRSKSGRRLTVSRNITADDRKKQQNKSAATRYREKKRSEEMENEVMCAELEKRNKELRTRVQDMTQEVAVLRKLVVDIFRSPNV